MLRKRKAKDKGKIALPPSMDSHPLKQKDKQDSQVRDSPCGHLPFPIHRKRKVEPLP